MQVGSQGCSHGAGLNRTSERAQMMHREMASSGQTKGERTVARLDQDGDGALSTAELKDTKLGRHMTVDAFARLDGNDDGMLEAGELDARRRPGRHHGHQHGQGTMESVVKAQYADYLTEKVDGNDGQLDVAKLIIAKLDGDQSGALNSEEISGTRLSKLIGGDFYQIDADNNGALNKAALSSFITGHLLGSSTEPGPEVAIEGDVSTQIPSGEPGPEMADANTEPALQTELAETDFIAADANAPSDVATGSVGDAPSPAAARAASVASAFETALEILKNGSGSDGSYDVVQALYGDVQRILESG